MAEMQEKKYRQLQRMARKQMKLMQEMRTQREREYQLMLWCGFLTGLRLTNAITKEEYDRYYRDLQEMAEKMDAA